MEGDNMEYENLKDEVRKYYEDCIELIMHLTETKDTCPASNIKHSIMFHTDFYNDVDITECTTKEKCFAEYGGNYGFLSEKIIGYNDYIVIINGKCKINYNILATIYGYGKEKIYGDEFKEFKKDLERNITSQ
jgi:hypothetical protein